MRARLNGFELNLLGAFILTKVYIEGKQATERIEVNWWRQLEPSPAVAEASQHH